MLGKDEEKISLHKPTCVKNYEGSSGGKEVAAALAVFNRSEAERGVRYIKYLGDGDSKAFTAVCQSKPYDIPVSKLECVGHVKKRMGTRLRNLKSKFGGKISLMANSSSID